MGGAAKAIEGGFIQKEIQDSAYNYQKDIESGKQIVVGVNKFQIEEGSPKGLLRVDPSVREDQIRRLEALKARRDNKKVSDNLSALKKAAGTDENLMPYILDCVKSYCTLGEICGVLREVFGEYQQSIVL
jgi:methylmalonyl-CoA mutase N-terminal domain/subunit